MSDRLKVAVLMGGTSSEREVSLSTGRQILGSLDRDKYVVYALDTATGQRELPGNFDRSQVRGLLAGDGKTEIAALTQLPQASASDRPDVVVIALHGRGGEDGTVQGMLDLLGIPYTGSGVLASALAMDKRMSKVVLTASGVRMPRDVAVKRGEPVDSAALDALPLPWIVKPNAQGSTIGMTQVASREELDAALATAFEHDDTALIEQFVTGTEITAPVLGNAELEILPIVEIVPAGGWYDYAAKYTPGATDEIVPARISETIAIQARAIARRCHESLGCRGMSRTDMIVTADGLIYTLEVNTIPGMTPTSLLPRAAQAAGIAFPHLLDRLIGYALEGR